MCVYNSIMKNHEKEMARAREQLARKTKECESLRKELAEYKKQPVLESQTSNQSKNADSRQPSSSQTVASQPSELQILKNETEALRKKNAQLEAQVKELSSTKEKKEFESEILLRIPCPEKSLFSDEIKDYLMATLYSALEKENQNFPKNKTDEHFRKQDVLNSILSSKTFRWEKTETNKKLSAVYSSLHNHKKYNYGNLQACGFTKKENCKNHLKYYFYSECYQLTFSLTPSDGNASKQQIREIKKRCFLMPDFRNNSGNVSTNN